jgi:hypothetical protein
MKTVLLLVFISVEFGCFTKKPQVVTNETVNTNTPMYPGHTILATNEVPAEVRNAWEKQHSAVTGEQWYKTDEGFIAYYPYRELQSRISYDANGKILTTSREVKGEDVPVPIRDFMKTKYPGIQYGKTYFCYPSEGDKYYEVQVDDKWEQFDRDGNNIGKNKSPVDENNK